MKINWTEIASIGAAISAIASLISIGVGFRWNKKMYKADMIIKPKIEELHDLRDLIPIYISNINYASYLFFKASANQRDKMMAEAKALPRGVVYGKVNFEDYDKQMDKTKALHEQLVALLRLQNNQVILNDVEELWDWFGKKNDYNQDSTNACLSKKEEKFNNLLHKRSSKLNDDFIKDYQNKIKLYQKGKSSKS